MSTVVKVEERTAQTKGDMKKLREQGYVPASVSGKKIQPTSLAIEEKELHRLLRGHSHEVLEMEIPGQGKQAVMMKEIQRDKMVNERLLHVDFQQISMDDPVKTMVPIELHGDPFGVGEGGILQPMLTELEIKALPRDLPHAIQANVSGLGIGDKLLVSDLQMPSGVECLIDETTLVATVLQVRKTTEEEQEEMAAEAEGKGGLEDNSGVKLSDRPNAEDAKETSEAGV